MLKEKKRKELERQGEMMMMTELARCLLNKNFSGHHLEKKCTYICIPEILSASSLMRML